MIFSENGPDDGHGPLEYPQKQYEDGVTPLFSSEAKIYAQVSALPRLRSKVRRCASRARTQPGSASLRMLRGMLMGTSLGTPHFLN